MNYRRFLSGAVLVILAVAAIALNYRQVEAQDHGHGGVPVRILIPDQGESCQVNV
jgi:hypothetical protein